MSASTLASINWAALPCICRPRKSTSANAESVFDVGKNLERLVQGIMIRTFAHEIVEQMAEWACIPIINGLTDFSHPCQALADYLTVLECKGSLPA